jgi:hypothetical protein
MVRRLPRLLFLALVIGCFCKIASADQIGVGLLTYDAISASDNEFDITNLTGTDAFPPDFPITTQLDISVTSLVVDLAGGSTITLPGSDFTTVDSEGDEDCTGAGCNLFGDNITSATLTGTFSPTTGLSGLPAGDTGIEAAFTTTITPACGTTYLDAGCDAAEIYATGTSTTTAPEPGILALVGIGITGLLLIGRKRLRGADTDRMSIAVV